MLQQYDFLSLTNHIYATIFPTSSILDDLYGYLTEKDKYLNQVMDVLVNIKHDSWGPKVPHFPAPKIPDNVDPIIWKRKKVISVAKSYIGLPYRHHHIPHWEGPQGKGIDCSNLTAWVYNYGLGIKFSSHLARQADGLSAPGRKLDRTEKFKPGDLLFIENKTQTISHVVLYIGGNKILDVRGKGGVQIRKFKGWYKNHFVFARRIIE